MSGVLGVALLLAAMLPNCAQGKLQLHAAVLRDDTRRSATDRRDGSRAFARSLGRPAAQKNCNLLDQCSGHGTCKLDSKVQQCDCLEGYKVSAMGRQEKRQTRAGRCRAHCAPVPPSGCLFCAFPVFLCAVMSVLREQSALSLRPSSNASSSSRAACLPANQSFTLSRTQLKALAFVSR